MSNNNTKSKKGVLTRPKGRKQFMYLSLSSELNEDLKALAATEKVLNSFYHIIFKLTNNMGHRKYINHYGFRKMSSTYMAKFLGSRYYNYTNALREAGIIEVDDEIGVNVCLGYRISPKYLFDRENDKVTFHYRYQYESRKEMFDAQEHIKTFKKFFDTLEIPFVGLYAAVEQKVSEMSLNDYKVDEDIEWIRSWAKVTEIDDNWNECVPQELSKEDALEIAWQKNKVLIKDGGRIIMVDLNQFMDEQKNFVRLAWTSQIDNLSSDSGLYGKRNDTNNRLDTNFTSLPTVLMEKIIEHNGMVEADTMNSQPAFLAHIIEKDNIEGEDVELFKTLANEEGFYEHFERHGLTRGESKKMIFKVFFGNIGAKSKHHTIFRKEFPNVNAWIRAYKNEFGYNHFAIMLQRTESAIFIDEIYVPLVKMGVRIFTKHDSVIYDPKDHDKVMEHIKNVFKSIGFKGKIREPQLNKVA